MKNANRFVDDVSKSIPDPDVVDLNWYPLITTLYKKLLDDIVSYIITDLFIKYRK
jgi:hypothetical protein